MAKNVNKRSASTKYPPPPIPPPPPTKTKTKQKFVNTLCEVFFLFCFVREQFGGKYTY